MHPPAVTGPLLLAVSLALASAYTPKTTGGTLKVYVLAGQSNMEGHAEVATIDPKTGKVTI